MSLNEKGVADMNAGCINYNVSYVVPRSCLGRVRSGEKGICGVCPLCHYDVQLDKGHWERWVSRTCIIAIATWARL